MDTPLIRASQFELTTLNDPAFSVDVPLPRGIRSGDLKNLDGDETNLADDLTYYQVILTQVNTDGHSYICRDGSNDECIKATFKSSKWQFEAYTITTFPDTIAKPKSTAEDCPDNVDLYKTTVIAGKKFQYAECLMIDGSLMLSVVIHENDTYFMLTARGSKGQLPTYTWNFFHSFKPV